MTGDDAIELARLLDARNEHPESLAEIDGEIWRRFGRTRAVLVLDMCGFSRLTMRYGVTHFLAMIRRLATSCGRWSRRGRRDRQDRGRQRVRDVRRRAAGAAAARTIQRSLDAANVFLPEDWDLHAGIGIGYGPLLLIGEVDCSAPR